tara:strand:- start:516 stop:629 length:114 start_codon:yes stop_codon:yes gene_type:complete
MKSKAVFISSENFKIKVFISKIHNICAAQQAYLDFIS